MSEMSPQFTKHEVAEFQEIFCFFDKRGDDNISVSQLGDIVRASGENPTQSEIEKLVQKYEEHECITFDVFLIVLKALRLKRTTNKSDDFIEGLRHFDKEGTGLIRSEELHHLLTTFGEKLTDAETALLLDGHEDSNGNIDYENFVNVIVNN